MNDDLRFEIHGSKGALSYGSMEPNWLNAYDCRDEDNPIGGNRGFKRIETVQRYPEPCTFPGPKFSIGWIRSHVASLYDFLMHVTENKPTSLNFEDGLYIQRVIDAGYRSAESGRLGKSLNQISSELKGVCMLPKERLRIALNHEETGQMPLFCVFHS